MASLSIEPNKRWTLQFLGVDGKRRSIRLGKISKSAAESYRHRVNELESIKKINQRITPELLNWAQALPDNQYNKLSAGGIAPKRHRQSLEAFILDFIDQSQVKASTKTIYRRVLKHLTKHFDSEVLLHTITNSDAKSWQTYLIDHGLSNNTVRQHCRIAKQFFKDAISKNITYDNPFEGMATTVQANKERFYYISHEDADKIITACPDAQWRLIFSLCRYGGLRCPSEVLGLRWDDINWDKQRITIRSPKTEHHAGGESREIPLFHELLSPLTHVKNEISGQSDFIITRYRDSNSNLRTQLKRIISKTDIKPWPKLFQNLRSTRETELMDEHPSHAVCAWIGNSEAVAKKHYLQVTDDHFSKAVQNPVQRGDATALTDNHGDILDDSQAKTVESLRTSLSVIESWCVSKIMGPEGLEPS